ncbi:MULTISPECIES: L-fuconate dehydratase [unclassified Streptomyces]|uniref:L-fuconate dehydratase n=1 Tax=unclassified Streptomyces TaxID=2593676 RepID=UPI0013BC198A|nr:MULTISPECIES: L-fuconate dehydratase [unclassified Streptomyces]NEB30151.1 L-fuconate dehydratase [Streptomyces sp. SID14446]MCX4918324.1 L-fuconate dehydratase [Streptomyces sp. NBC_00687]MCX5135454.1 L-fuconate dehydratase [Streptomyces sp. NBC_00340]MCX5280422.1 L-fuconate dehydratase [Streptomyces sp. NBC_00198]WSD76367.1 L-fuconate dehydratase [Streptomyces sp. NBC_01558]
MSPTPARITAVDTYDVRFPTSRELDGSDAMNPDPDYSAAYVVLRSDAPDGAEGHGFTFTIGRGNDVQVAAIDALRGHVLGRPVDELCADPGSLSRDLVGDSQLRWLGPEKGVMHMAIGAVVNAVWDLAAKRARKPLWQLLAEADPAWLVGQVDFRYITDALTPDEALHLLRRGREGATERTATLRAEGFPAYTTSPGWLGYSDEKLTRLAAEAVAGGFRQIKLKVGADLADDLRRCRVARAVVGPDIRIAIDANQRWNVDEAIDWTRALAEFEPYWIEEPTSPDDILGHAAVRSAVAPVKVATGEHVQNRIVFKQLLQAGSVDVLQIDAARVGGVNENLAILLLAAKFGIPVCPHAGGVGLCELVQHLSMFDFVALAGTTDDRVIEYVDHLHDHFTEPVVIRDGRYTAPTAPGFSATMRPESIAEFTYPDGTFWTADLAQRDADERKGKAA